MRKINFRELNILKDHSDEIPIFFACDDSYVKYTMVAIRSLIDNSSIDNYYHIFLLSTDISEVNKAILESMETRNVSIEVVDVTAELKKISSRLSVRDYYSLTTYYRIFIADMFPEFDKVLYLDSDIVLLNDVAELYNYNLGDNYVGAVQDYLVAHTEIFGDYVENVLGISRSAYFNAGVLLINSKAFRKQNMKSKFTELLEMYTFVVAQDQDYLNILCQNKVLWVNSKWNFQMSEPEAKNIEKKGLIHYNFAEKPWHFEDGKYAEYFWDYAADTHYYNELRVGLETYTKDDMEKDFSSGEHLLKLAQQEIENENNYLNLYVGTNQRKITRQDIIEKIKQYEREGRFDEDVEDDPPGRVLMPNEIDYLDNSIKKKLQRRYAYKIARWFMRLLIRNKQLIIKEIRGIENYRALNSGAVITCNHINPMDSFAMQIAFQKSHHYTRKLYRIIKEGNYTTFPGFFGFLMRNCNTLPLSSNKQTMKKLMKAVDTLLGRGHFILIYPEQSMWWNYKKPKPLKKGGYIFAARNNVPVLPCFITMTDSDIPGEGGLPVQEYTIHIGKAIYPDPSKNKNENVREMMEKNFECWKQIYETFYGIPLSYETIED